MPQVPQKETGTDGHGYLDLLLSLRCVPAGVCGDKVLKLELQKTDWRKDWGWLDRDSLRGWSVVEGAAS